MFWAPGLSIGVSAAASGPHALSNAVPLVVRSGQAHLIGPMSANTSLRFMVTLKIRSWSKLNATLKAISTPGSPRYDHYLTQTQANRLFNPTVEQQKQVVSWLRSNGLRVTATFVNHLGIEAKGPVGSVERAFGVSMERYSGTLYGKAAKFYAPSTAPVVPARLSTIVNGVIGLDNTTRIVSFAQRPILASAGIRPHGDINSGGYYPSDYRAAYGVPSSDAGAGQHIGITLFDDPPSNSSLTTWADKVGLGATPPTTTSGRLIVHKIDGGVGTGDSGESGIDVENSFGLAPKATIDYWEFNDQDQNIDAAAVALNTAGTTGPKSRGLSGLPLESQISSSWGTCEDSQDDSANEDPIFASDSATGHDFLFASGDTGSYCGEFNPGQGNDDPFPQYPASSPYVTAVGGTAFGKDGNATPITLTSYPGEVSWYYDPKGNNGGPGGQCAGDASNTCPAGSSGGYSTQYKRPWWQTNAGLGTLGKCATTAGKHLCRAFPDVAAAGDPNFAGAYICYSAGCEVDGGTSLATPIWAGMLADMNSYIVAHTGDSGVGFLNPSLYFIAGHNTYHSDFHDVTCPDTSTRSQGGCTNGKYNTTANWDAVTGLGSPNVAKLQAELLYWAR